VVQRHRLINDKLRHLIRDYDKNEPPEDDFEFFSQETLRVPGSSKRVLSYRESEAGQKCLKTLL
jgi:hypothetical protein